MTTLRIARLELGRMLRSRRWGVVALSVLLAAWLAESSLRAAAFNAHAAAHAEDVVLSLVNNVMLVGYLLLPAFALVASGTLAADRASGFVALSLSRAGRRRRLWAAKVAPVIVAALVTQALVLCAGYGMASISGYRSSGTPSALALLPETETSMTLFAPARPGDDMRMRVAVAIGHLALVFAAFGSVALAASLLWNKESVPPALVLSIVFFDWLAARFSHWSVYRHLSPSLHLLESTHLPTMPGATPWGWSLAYFGLWLLFTSIGGGLLFERTDI